MVPADPDRVCCMVTLYQEKGVWGSETCESVTALPRATGNGSEGDPPFSVGNASYSSHLSRQEE